MDKDYGIVRIPAGGLPRHAYLLAQDADELFITGLHRNGRNDPR